MAVALVTGGTGFVGSHIVRALVTAGHSVRVLRRQSSPTQLISDLPIEHCIGDILDIPSLDRAMQGCTWVFHVAAVSDYWRTGRAKLYLVNVNGTHTVMESARKAGVSRVIITSSAAAVGFRPDGMPSNETLDFNLKPNQFAYGHSKWLAEQEVLRAVSGGQDAVILNPAQVYGPGDLNQISGSAIVEVSRGNVPIYPAGSATFIDVRDVAQAHLAAAEKGRSGERYILGAEDWSYKAAMTLIAEIADVPRPKIKVPAFIVPAMATIIDLARSLGIKLPLAGDQARLSARNATYDCHKAWTELGAPQISIRQSVQDTYDWYVEHGVITRL